MLSMQGKNVVIFGVANKRSIAWAIAQRLNDAGAKLAITYQNERMKAEAHDLIKLLVLDGRTSDARDFGTDYIQRCGEDSVVEHWAHAPPPGH